VVGGRERDPAFGAPGGAWRPSAIGTGAGVLWRGQAWVCWSGPAEGPSSELFSALRTRLIGVREICGAMLHSARFFSRLLELFMALRLDWPLAQFREVESAFGSLRMGRRESLRPGPFGSSRRSPADLLGDPKASMTAVLVYPSAGNGAIRMVETTFSHFQSTFSPHVGPHSVHVGVHVRGSTYGVPHARGHGGTYVVQRRMVETM
jgi:hypothetical protein